MVNCWIVFIDRKIPEQFDKNPPKFIFNSEFSPGYFVELHHYVSSFGQYNYLGARTRLKHNRINVDQFRKLLPETFEDLAILQYLEFGFPCKYIVYISDPAGSNIFLL